MIDATPPPRGFMVAYGLSHGGKSLIWQASELLFAYFLTESCGLPPRQMAMILGLSLLLNALADLVGGQGLGRWVRTSRDAGRLQAIGALLCGAAFVAFGFAGLVPAPSRFAFALTSIIAFRLTYAMMDLPQNALLALSTSSQAARVRLTALRYEFGGLASILVAGAFAPLLRNNDDAIAPVAFAVFSAILAASAIASAALLWRRLRERGASPQAGDGAGDGAAPRVAQCAPPSFRRWPILLIAFIMAASLSIFGRLEPYFVTYGLKSPLDGGALLVCGAAGAMVSQPFWSRWARRRCLVSALRAATITMSVGALVFGLAAQHGLAPAALCGGLYGWGYGGVLMSLWALTASATGGHRHFDGATATFGLLTFATKLALALSAFWIGEFLTLADYRTDGGQGLLTMMTTAPLIGAGVSLVLTMLIVPRPVAGRREAPPTGLAPARHLRRGPTCP